MNTVLFFPLVFISQLALASIESRPADFQTQLGADPAATATFVDFLSAKTTIQMDATADKMNQTTIITLEQINDGHIVLDLVQNPTQATLDGKPVELIAVRTPNRESTVRVLSVSSLRGTHELIITSPLKGYSEWTLNVFNFRFRSIDLLDRSFLEKYLPTNLEYDQYKMEITIESLNQPLDHFFIATNGMQSAATANSATYEFPDYYNCSSVYFHLLESTGVVSETRNFLSLDGRLIPVLIFKTEPDSKISLPQFFDATFKSLTDLEAQLGPYPHPQLVIYANSDSSMEYAGAFSSALTSVPHELFHIYLGRLAMPANGNAGWIDEAVNVWAQGGFTATSTLSRLNVAGLGPYTRSTSMDSYEKGSKFVGYLAYRSAQNGKDFKEFLRVFIQKYARKTYTTEIFQAELESWLGVSLQAEFNTGVYGK